MSALLDGLKALGAARLAAMAAVGVAMLAMLAVLASRGGTERMALLYGDLDPREAGQMTEQLDRLHIPQQLAGSGTQILVPADQVARARVLLAKDGLPSSGSMGYELLDKADGITASQFQQRMAEVRALEGEIARSIRTISGVRAARVHLVLPKREPFARERIDAQASVVLTMNGAARLDGEGVQAILNLVSGAVPGLRPKNIALVDSHGSLLARPGEAGPAGMASNAEEIRRAAETRLSRAVEEMLERSLGAGHVRAEATVEMDFEHIQETQERYDPEGQVVRSTQTSNETSRTTEANATVSVQNSLPNADAGNNNQAGSQDGKQDETINYEIGKTVRTVLRDQPQIRRLSLAVLVDGVEEKGLDGAVQWKPRPQEELDRIARVVRGAVGYDEKRGDHVDVVSMRFAGDGAAAGVAPHALLGLPMEKADLMRLAQTGLVGLVALAALLLVFRPMIGRLTSLAGPAGGAVAALPGGGGDALTLAGSDYGLARAGVKLVEGPADASAMLEHDGGEGDNMVTLTSVDGQMRASSLRRLAELVERHPDESLSIVRSWMQQEAAP